MKPLNAPTSESLEALAGNLAAIQWYVNTGGIENDFSFSRATVNVRRPDGQVVQIYPITNIGTEGEVNALNQIRNTPTESDNTWLNPFSYVLLIPIILSGIGIVVFVRLRKGKVK